MTYSLVLPPLDKPCFPKMLTGIVLLCKNVVPNCSCGPPNCIPQLAPANARATASGDQCLVD